MASRYCEQMSERNEMKNTAVIIRSSGDLNRISYLENVISDQNFADVYLAVDCTDGNYEKAHEIREKYNNLHVVILDKKFIENKSLSYFSRCTWQCGDYFYYVVYSVAPGYEYYWLVDDDVVFNTDITKFLKKASSYSEDLLGIEVGPRKGHWGWYESMNGQYPNSVFGMLYPLSRLSNKAVAYLFEKRVLYRADVSDEEYRSSKSLIRNHANDEAFTATTLRNNGYSSKSLYQIFKKEFSGYFSTERPVLYEELDKAHTADKVIHPVTDFNRARSKFEIIYKKYGARKMLNRANEITEHCGPETWGRCFDVSLVDLQEEAIAEEGRSGF